MYALLANQRYRSYLHHPGSLSFLLTSLSTLSLTSSLPNQRCAIPPARIPSDQAIPAHTNGLTQAGVSYPSDCASACSDHVPNFFVKVNTQAHDSNKRALFDQ